MPVFVRSAGNLLDVAGGADEPPAEAPARGSESEPSGRTRARLWALAGAAFAAGVLGTLLAAALRTRSAAGGPAVDRMIRAAWEPLLGPSADTVVFIASPAHLSVRRLPSDSAIEAGRPRDDERYGLITVLSSGRGPGGTRTVLFSGLASAGTQAAAEYFSSPDLRRQLAAKFKAEGLDGFPGSYQVLLRARAVAILPVRVEYVRHCILDR